MKLQPKGAITYTCHECKQMAGNVYCYYQGKAFCTRRCWETFRVSAEYRDFYRREKGADVDSWGETPTGKIP